MIYAMRAPVPPAVVVFAGARDDYQLPIALQEIGCLESLVTDLYFPDDALWFRNSLGKIIPRTLIHKRFSAELDSRKVSVAWSGVGTVLAAALHPGVRIMLAGNRLLGKRARRMAEKRGAAMFALNSYAYDAFHQLSSPYRFLFQFHPHPVTNRAILMQELRDVPCAENSLRYEYELGIPPRTFEQLSQEPALANGWVAASTFTANTLVANGIPREMIHIVPYGVDFTHYPRRPAPRRRDAPFTVVFAGQLVQRKGISYLLEAARRLHSNELKLVFCTRTAVETELLKKYSDVNAEVRLGLTREELVRQFHDSDIFCLPSLIEGFGHVILQAMSCSLPVLSTPHTCAPDVVREGVDGFIVPIKDSDAIAERISWGIDHRPQLEEMGQAAAEHARTFTWPRFRAGIQTAYGRMIASIDGSS